MRDGALSGEPWEIPGAPLSNGADPEKGGAVRLVGRPSRKARNFGGLQEGLEMHRRGQRRVNPRRPKLGIGRLADATATRDKIAAGCLIQVPREEKEDRALYGFYSLYLPGAFGVSRGPNASWPAGDVPD